MAKIPTELHHRPLQPGNRIQRIPLKQLVLKNCGLETSSAHVLGELLRPGELCTAVGRLILPTARCCHYLEDLVLLGNQAGEAVAPVPRRFAHWLTHLWKM